MYDTKNLLVKMRNTEKKTVYFSTKKIQKKKLFKKIILRKQAVLNFEKNILTKEKVFKILIFNFEKGKNSKTRDFSIVPTSGDESFFKFFSIF